MTLDPTSCRAKLSKATLYLLLTRSRCLIDPLRVLDEALDAGVDLIQVREPEMQDRELLEWVHDVRERTAIYHVPLIVNDRVDIALLGGAEGVHVGQGDLPPTALRELASNRLLIGLSTHDSAQVLEAASDVVDYLGVGPLFDTSTKGLVGRGVGLLEEILPLAKQPAFGIGGITEKNLPLALEAGLRRAAVSAAICGSRTPGTVTRTLLQMLDQVSPEEP